MVFYMFLAMMLMFLALKLDCFWFLYFMPIPLMFAYKKEQDIENPTFIIDSIEQLDDIAQDNDDDKEDSDEDN